MCMCIWCMHVWNACGVTCVEAWGQRSVFLYHCPPHFLMMTPLTRPGVHDLPDWMTSEPLGSTWFCPTMLSLQGRTLLPCFYKGAGNPNSGSHAYEVDTHFLPQNHLLRPQYGGSRTSGKWNKYSLFLCIYYNITLLYYSLFTIYLLYYDLL